MNSQTSSDLARKALQLLFLGALLATSFWILKPFLPALLWAVMIAVATWPVLLRLQAWLGNRRGPAVALMTVALLLVLVMPLYFGIEAIVGNAEQIVSWSKSLATLSIPQPPAWLETLPLIGTRLAARWRQLAALAPEEIAPRVAPYVQNLAVWFVRQVGSIGLLLLQFLLTVIMAAIMYANGETAARGTIRFARRLAGPQGENSAHLAGQAIRGVALGVVVTAILQTTLAGLGLVVAGVPFASVLIVVVFILCIAQIGPMLVLLPATFWVYSLTGAVWGTLFLLWSVFCGTLDNFVRPVLIRRGADLPLLLIFSGVIGGLIAIGVIGLFIGPVVLAVAYTLLANWVSEGDASDDREPSAMPDKGDRGSASQT